jgi:hypothetical protein
MKKHLIIALLAVMAGLIASEVKAQPPWAPAWGKRRKQQEAYYYYPRANVYYSPATRHYIYPRNGVWVSVATPNFGFSFSNMPRETVYYEGPDIWVENRIHIERYHGIWHDDDYYNPYYSGNRYYYKRYKHHHHDEDEDDDD